MKKLFIFTLMCMVFFCMNAQNIIKNNYNSRNSSSTNSSTPTATKNGLFISSSPYIKVGYLRNLTNPEGGESSSIGTFYGEFGNIWYVTPQVPICLGLGIKYLYDFDNITVGKNTIKTSFSSINLRVPLNIGYNIIEQDNWGITLRTGPYLDWAVYGYSKVDGNKTSLSDIDGYKTLLAGWNIGANFHFNNLSLFGEYGFGVTERNKNVNENYWCLGLMTSF